MKLYEEYTANDFPFWSGAKDTVEVLTAEELEQVWDMLEEVFSDIGDTASHSTTNVNDFFWFEDETIANWLGYSDWDELVEAHKEKEDE